MSKKQPHNPKPVKSADMKKLEHRWTCQIRIQCMEDEDDFCSLGTREE